MFTKPPIPMDERFIRWLTTQVQQLQSGSISLEVDHGQLKYVSCHGHRYFYALDELTETSDPSC